MTRRAAVIFALLFLSATLLAQFNDDVPLMPPPRSAMPIYGGTDAKKEIRDALAQARKSGKHVLLDFGGDWCYDCHVLDYNMSADPRIRAAVEADYVVAHVDVGEFNKNLDLCKKYRMTIAKGVPALAVLNAGGKLLYSDPGGFFEHARGMTRTQIMDFLRKWAPKKR